jgi:hypothetical protein
VRPVLITLRALYQLKLASSARGVADQALLRKNVLIKSAKIGVELSEKIQGLAFL